MRHWMKNQTCKRIFSWIMVMAMVLGLMPAAVFALPETRTVYLNAGGNSLWDQAGAWFDAWVWGSSQADAWYTFADTDFDGVYEVQIPADATGMKILRKDPASHEHNWNKWNETGDLSLSDYNCYTITGWSATSGSWSNYTPVAPTFTVAGEAGLCGTAWDVSNTANDMTKTESGTYQKVYTDVAAGTYQYKVVLNHSWDKSWGNGSNNASVTVAEAGSTVTVTFDPAAGTVSAQTVKLYSVTYQLTNLTATGEAQAVKGSDYAAVLTPAEGFVLPQTVEVTMGGTAITPTWDPATGSLGVSNVTGDLVITAQGEQEQTTLYLKPNTNWVKDNARFAMYLFGSSNTWVSMTDPDNDGIYEAVVPDGAWTHVIFCRMNPGVSANSWDAKWNQTGDLTLPTDDKVLYTINAGQWDSGQNGSWSVYTPAAPVVYSYTVAGEAGLCGTAWDVSNTANDMTKNSAGLYEKVYENVAAGTYQFKVARDHSWDVSYGNGSSNVSLTVETDGSSVAIYFDEATKAITTQVTAPAEPETPETVTVYFQNNWLWTDVCVYYWGTTADPTWPGIPMTYVETQDGLDIYSAQIPVSATNIIFNGIRNEGTDRDQSPDLPAPADGDAYQMHWDNGNQCILFPYTPGGTEPEPEGDVEYQVIFHFANTLGWGSVNLYTWTEGGANPTGAWPGTATSLDGSGFYSHTVTYTAPAGQGLNFIFNNGSVQTVDLSIPAEDFTDHKCEKWVVLTTQTDGKYHADQFATGDALAVSPVVNGTSVTFQYKAPEAAAVAVHGDFSSWNAVAMTKNAYGIWSVTVDDLAAGIHEYKFVVDSSWVTDPLNSWQENGNSAFLISDPEQDINTVTLNIHYTRADGNYENWNVYWWNGSGAGQYDFTAGEGEVVAKVELSGRGTQDFSFKIRKSVGSNKWAAEEAQVTVDLSTIVSGTIDIYVTGGSAVTTQKLGNDVVYANKVKDVQYDYEKNIITVTTNKSLADPATAFTIVNISDSADGIAITYDPERSSGNNYVYIPSRTLELKTLHQLKLRFLEQDRFTETLYDIHTDDVYATERFAAEYTYNGSDLGASYTQAATTFRVWAPTAQAVSVKLYATGSDGESGAAVLGQQEMTQDVNGTWICTVEGDLNGVYYTYLVQVDGRQAEAVDPYARAVGVNGNRGMILDLNSTDPTGWENDRNPNPITSYTDAVLYELHVRDFSIDPSSGVSQANRGKFLAFTETGTTVSGKGEIATGVDYLKQLGITHLHLLPVYDFASVDETTGTDYNWGYDPQNYNVPEGSYASDPYRGDVRIREMKQMVQALHNSGISVVMDVVYNHVYDASTFGFNQIVPGYFSRVDSNRSGCGNDTASEREMVRKYIVESVLYWVEEYHIDGFRFDLVGLLDVQTVNQIVEEVHKIRPDVIFYGEGWDMDGTNKEPGTEMAKQGNAAKTPDFAYFSDNIRNLLGGDNGKSTGFASGSNGREGEVVSNFLANPWWTSNPTQVVQYASCHDNHTLADKIILSTGRTQIDSTVFKMNNLAAAVYMTAQGIPFIHAGEEILREKLDENGKRNENSYNASDYVNHIRWDNLEKEAYRENMAYYQGLIAFRKAHPALRLATAQQVKQNVFTREASGNVVAFWIDGSQVTGETHDSIYIIFNANQSARTLQLPAGNWDVCIAGSVAGTQTLKTVSGSVEVEGISATVLVQKQTTEEPGGSVSKSDVALPGSFNEWNQSNFMDYAEDSDTLVEQTLSLPAGSYTFKIKIGSNWYGNNGTIEDTTDTTSATGWDMSASAGDCTLKASGGAYTFIYDTATGKLIIRHDPQGGDFGSPDEYYLYGYINNVDYAMGVEPGEYRFDEDGKLTVTFTADSYVCVKNGDASKKFMTKGWLGSVTSATMYDVVAAGTTTGYDKLMVPGGSQVTFTLVHNDDGTITLSYAVDLPTVVDGTGIQDGVTLHCWNWSFAQIEANMALIAAQGYTAIQTSPVQALKEDTNRKNHSVGGNWWVYYQPVDFVITSDDGNALGTKQELASMIETAHRYGVKVIVDVVANHLANQTGNNLSDKIPEYLRQEDYWHDITKNTTDYNDRYDVTQHCMAGLPDLNTGNKELQGFVLQFLMDCVDLGVDGFRFDGAKHIETPQDDASFASDFWPVVIGGAESYAKKTYGKDLYMYGEVLDTINGLSLSAYTQFMAITDNSWGNSLRGSIVKDQAALSAGYNKAVDPQVLVLWAESHDTYATDDPNQSSFQVTQEDILKTWALVAARADAMGLYFARPESMEQAIGVASVTGWADPAVKAVNQFHNAFAGQSEAVANENGISYVVRGTTGAVLVQVGQAVQRSGEISVAALGMADGTYTDQIGGGVFTVANGKITGPMGQSGVAVLYNAPAEEEFTITVHQSQGGKAEADVQKAAMGDQVTLTVTPEQGNTLAQLTVTDAAGNTVPTTDNGDGTHSFRMPNGPVSVTLSFRADSGNAGTGDPFLVMPVAVGMAVSLAGIYMVLCSAGKKRR